MRRPHTWKRITPAAILLLLGVLSAPATSPASEIATPSREDAERTVLWERVRSLPPGERPRIGLVLGGGGARGLAHAGVITVLEREGVPIDMIAGTSIGAFIGALEAAGARGPSIEEIARRTDWSNLIELRISRIGFLSTRRLERFINLQLQYIQRDILNLPREEEGEEYITGELHDVTFDELEIPFICAATDMRTGERVVFDSGPVGPAIRASCSVPGLFEPYHYGGRVFLDGGIVENLPVDLARSMGADIVIAVDVEYDIEGARDPENFIDVLTRVIHIQGMHISDRSRAGADLLIEPEVGGIGLTELNRGGEAIEEGRSAAEGMIDEIKDTIIGEAIGQGGDWDGD